MNEERRRQIRQKMSEARCGQSLGQVIPWDDIEALLDAHDDCDRYRGALEKIATGRITGEQKHSEYASELRSRIAQDALKGLN